MSGYELLKFLHVLAVIAWVGGGLGIFVLQARLRGAGDRRALTSVGGQMEDLGRRYYSPMAGVTLVTGIWMVAIADGISFGEAWIIMGLAGIVASTAIGIGMITPAGKKLIQESQKADPDPAAVASYANRIRGLGLTNIIILVIVVWAMVVQPG